MVLQFICLSQRCIRLSKPGSLKVLLRRPTSRQYASQKLVGPEVMRLYHCGRGKLAFVGILKLLPFVIWGTNLIIIGWAAYKDTDKRSEILQKAPQALGLGLIPLFYVIISAPFVPLVLMRLPVHARTSREAITQFANKLPPTTELGFTTITWYGRPRVTWVRVSDLRPTTPSFAIENIVWVSPPKIQQRKTYLDEPLRAKFFVGKPSKKTFESSIWDKVFAIIQSQGVK